ncbi:MAG: hypothetical protein MN733_23695 [Nitrososphaera sp.]|nr:hypothetical protein [Nitrososphaera sp.]
MSSLRLLSKSKLQQKATLMLINKVEELRACQLNDPLLAEGDGKSREGNFGIEWSVQDHTPFYGTKQVRARVMHKSQVIVETLFYKSE